MPACSDLGQNFQELFAFVSETPNRFHFKIETVALCWYAIDYFRILLNKNCWFWLTIKERESEGQKSLCQKAREITQSKF